MEKDRDKSAICVDEVPKGQWQNSYPHDVLNEEWHRDLLILEKHPADFRSEADVFMDALHSTHLDDFLRFWKYIGHSEAVFMLRKDDRVLVIWVRPVWDFPYAIFAYKDTDVVFGDRDQWRDIPGLAARNLRNVLAFILLFFQLEDWPWRHLIL